MPSRVLTGFFSPVFANAPSAFAYPAVYASLGNDPFYKAAQNTGTQVGPPAVFASKLIAVIDTGSDVGRIDKRFVELGKLESVGTVNSVLVGIPSIVSVYYAQVHFDAINYTLHGKFPIAPFRENGLNFDMLIGMDLLKNFDVRVNQRLGLVSLEYIVP